MKSKIIIKILIIFLLVILINNISYGAMGFPTLDGLINGEDQKRVTDQINPGQGSKPQQGSGSQSSAPQTSGGGTETGVINPDTFDPSKANGSNTKANEIVGIILGGVQGVGSIVSVLALVIIGVRYMLGSIEEKAEYKKTMIPYLIGAVLLFLSSNIVGALYDIFS